MLAESATGARAEVEADERGCFTLAVPAGPVRLRCRTEHANAVTEWVSLR